MHAVFTLRVPIDDDSDAADMIERAKKVGRLDEAWEEVTYMLEDGVLAEDVVVVENLEIIR